MNPTIPPSPDPLLTAYPHKERKSPIEITASPELCFDLARSTELHVESAAESRERFVGVAPKLLDLGDEVTWSGRHFGLRLRLTSSITVFDRPRHFRDSMVRGPFRRFDHDHLFEETPAGTRMTDVFDYSAPGWFVGRLAEKWLLTKYLTRFLAKRASVLKRVAETDEWMRFAPPDGEQPRA